MSAVVVGAGLAGLTAGVRLAEAGRRVTLLALGVGGLHLSPGMIDVAGYVPERVADPRAGVRALAGNGAGHPYAVLGLERVERAVEWLRSALPEAGLSGDLDRNLLLPTAAGAARPTTLVPETMAAGILRPGHRYLIAGFRAFKDLHPRLVAANLPRLDLPGGGVSARSVMLEANPQPGRADVPAIAFARAMDDTAFRSVVAAELRPLVQVGEVVGVPALVGLRNAPAAWRDLQDRVGAPLFEIPTVPPCLPGIRMNDALVARLRQAGGRIVMGTEVVGLAERDGAVSALRAAAAGRERTYAADAFVFAPGGVESGALTVDSHGVVRERALGLPLGGLPPDGAPLFDPDYWADHPVMRAGVAVDARMRPTDAGGRAVYRNLHAAGAILAGAVPWREKSGEGIAVASGLAAADAILEEAS